MSSAAAPQLQYLVLWQLRPQRPWHKATFISRDEAMQCFFRQLSRGLAVRWEKAKSLSA